MKTTDPIENAFGTWCDKLKENGITYVDKLRATWKKREHDQIKVKSIMT